MTAVDDMTDQIANRISWTEVVSCISLTDKRISDSAHKYFDKNKYLSNKNQMKRSLVRQIIDALFDPNLSIFDVAERIRDEINGNS